MPDRTPPHSFVYGLDVNADQRRKGYGQAIMEAAMQECRERGIASMGLNVFGHNDTARRLYDRLGFQVTSTQHEARRSELFAGSVGGTPWWCQDSAHPTGRLLPGLPHDQNHGVRVPAHGSGVREGAARCTSRA